MVEFVAEFTTNHMGHLGALLRMVDRAAESGATSIKMQKKDVGSYYTEDKLSAEFVSPFGQTYRDYRTLFEFEHEDWERFDARCKDRSLPWFCTVHDEPSLRFMLQYGLPRYKIASSSSRDRDFLAAVADQVPRDAEVVVSVAGATLDDIEHIAGTFSNHTLWLLHCVAEYPCPWDHLRLGNILALRQRFGSDNIRIGYSGHEEGCIPTLAAIGLGAEMVERHFCLSRHGFVHHLECSLEPEEFAAMVDAARHDATTSEAVEMMPDKAIEAQFGMSETERKFLVEQSYGNSMVGDHSVLG